MDEEPSRRETPASEKSDRKNDRPASEEVIKEEQRRIELGKLRAETEKLLAELDGEPSRRRLEWVKSVGAFITAVVALLGVFLTFYLQQVQIQMLSEQADREALLETISSYGGSSEKTRLGAIASLGEYLEPHYPVVGLDEEERSQVAMLLVRGVETGLSESERNFTRDILVGKASLSTLNALAEQNRDLQARIASRLRVQPKAVAYLTLLTSAEQLGEIEYADGFFGVPIHHQEVVGHPITRAVVDEVAAVLSLLEWNISTMVLSLNRFSTVGPIDLGGVVLGRCQAEIYGPKGRDRSYFPEVVSLEPADEQLREGLVFSGTNLAESILCGMLVREVEFRDVNLDRSFLLQTCFGKCRFFRTSIRNVNTGFLLDVFTGRGWTVLRRWSHLLSSMGRAPARGRLCGAVAGGSSRPGC